MIQLERIENDSVSMKCPKCGRIYVSSADCKVDEEGYLACDCDES